MRIRWLICLLLPLPAVSAQQVATDTAIIASIDRFIRARAAADSFSGAVLVALNGTPILRAGYGLADRDKPAPITPQTKFNLGRPRRSS
jgi:CubicO group peptidase (beta-lactamase class C family)